MFDYSPAGDNDRLFDYSDANQPEDDEDWEPVRQPVAGPWFRNEIAEKIVEAIEDADPGQIDTDDGAVYEIVSFEVDQ